MFSITLLNTAILLLCITLFLGIVDTCKPLGLRLLAFLNDKFRTRASIEDPVDVPVEAVEKTVYNVESFNKRIEELMKNVDENGLYDLSEIDKMELEFTGTEIVTDDYESQLDRRL